MSRLARDGPQPPICFRADSTFPWTRCPASQRQALSATATSFDRRNWADSESFSGLGGSISMRATDLQAVVARSADRCGRRLSDVVLTNACGSMRPEWPIGARSSSPTRSTSPASHRCPAPPRRHRGRDRFVPLGRSLQPSAARNRPDVEPDIPEGIYVGFHGPEFETPAEIRMAKGGVAIWSGCPRSWRRLPAATWVLRSWV